MDQQLEQILSFRPYDQKVKLAQINKYENIILLVDLDNQLIFIDTFTKQVIKKIDMEYNIINVQFTKNTNFILIQTQQDILSLFDIRQNKILYQQQYQDQIQQFHSDSISKYKILVNFKNKSLFCDIKTNEKIEISNSQFCVFSQNQQKDCKQIIICENQKLKEQTLMHNKYKTISNQLLNFDQQICNIQIQDSKICLCSYESIIVYNLETKNHVNININQDIISISNEYLAVYNQNLLKFYNLKDVNQVKQIEHKYITQITFIKNWDNSILAIDSNSNIIIFTINYKQSWEAFGFKFQYIKNNEEYIEEEDEFDFKPNNKNQFNKIIDFGIQKQPISRHRVLLDFKI